MNPPWAARIPRLTSCEILLLVSTLLISRKGLSCGLGCTSALCDALIRCCAGPPQGYHVRLPVCRHNQASDCCKECEAERRRVNAERLSAASSAAKTVTKTTPFNQRSGSNAAPTAGSGEPRDQRDNQAPRSDLVSWRQSRKSRPSSTPMHDSEDTASRPDANMSSDRYLGYLPSIHDLSTSRHRSQRRNADRHTKSSRMSRPKNQNPNAGHSKSFQAKRRDSPEQKRSAG